MATLADLERLLEQVFERTTARVFRTRLQAVQVERKVERAMERARSTRDGQAVVPGRYRVRLHPGDLASLAVAEGDAEALAARLAAGALAFAREHGYRVSIRPAVAVVADARLQRGSIEVDAVADGPRAAAPAPAPWQVVEPAPELAAVPPPAPWQVPVAMTPVTDAHAPGAANPRPEPEPEPEPAATPLVGAGLRHGTSATGSFRRPVPAAPGAVLRLTTTSGAERVVELAAAPLTLGRADDNALVIPDPRVSRHHGRLHARHGSLVYTDLGSTNGSHVNGTRVDQCALGIGDRIVLGDTVLVVEQLPG